MSNVDQPNVEPLSDQLPPSPHLDGQELADSDPNLPDHPYPVDVAPADKPEAEFVDMVEDEDPELIAVRSALQAPGYAVGDKIELQHRAMLGEAGFFQIGIDRLGRVWRLEEDEKGERLVLAGRLTV